MRRCPWWWRLGFEVYLTVCGRGVGVHLGAADYNDCYSFSVYLWDWRKTWWLDTAMAARNRPPPWWLTLYRDLTR